MVAKGSSGGSRGDIREESTSKGQGARAGDKQGVIDGEARGTTERTEGSSSSGEGGFVKVAEADRADTHRVGAMCGVGTSKGLAEGV